MGERLVLDLETQREFAEVEGRKPELLGVSVVGIYSYETNRYDAFLEADIPTLAPRLKDAELVIGFNIRRFDVPVLQPYLPFPAAKGARHRGTGICEMKKRLVVITYGCPFDLFYGRSALQRSESSNVS